MMQLSCPWCGVRDETEFVCGGTTHIARPPLARDGCGLGPLSLLPRQPQGRAPRALAARVRLRAVVQRRARHRDARSAGGVPHGRAAAAARGLAWRASDLPLRPGRWIDRSRDGVVHLQWPRAARALPAIRSPPRCWPTACAWWAAASSSTARAGSGRAVSRSRARSWMSAAAARRTPNVRATLLPHRARAWSRSSVNCWPGVGFDLGALTGASRGAAAGRLLLQDLHVAELAAVRAGDPPHGGPRARPDRARPRSLRGAVAAVRRAGGGRRASPDLPPRRRRRGRRAHPARSTRSAHLGGALGWRADREVAALAARARSAGVRIRTRTRGLRRLRPQPRVRRREPWSRRGGPTCRRACCASGCGRSAHGR